MNCEEFRFVVGAEPSSTRPDVVAHAAECADCAAYRRELQAMDRSIFGALNLDVTAAAPPRRAASAQQRVWRVAAGIALVVVAAWAVWVAVPSQSLAAQIVDHVQHEPKSLVRTLDRVGDAELASVLARSGVRLEPGATRISYAMSCWFRGHFVPHLVVQTDAGPVTVLILPHERAPARAEAFKEAGFEGVILPAPRGAIAVLGQHGSLDGVGQAVLNALEYGGS